MVKLEQLKNAISEYQEKYRRPSSPKLKIEPEYSLFPDASSTGENWPAPYPSAGKAGVYAMLDRDRNVLYIGKVSMGNTLGSRLGNYFGFERDRQTCRIKHNWKVNPYSLLIVSTPAGMEFEAPAIEEYLITKFSKELPENKMGTSN